ncbi:MAG: hypothetical protein CVV61_04980 [Tenericutes bacterium HGW-Tenericutes-6]|jgi:fructose-specific phosphotransferase system IIB component|nr:MAG: hypothetical protein CVV61_04980 [Tenericutes bacterium HGW-Tenericutes-6]
MKIVAVTACPTGIAHTYMAEEKLIEAAQKKKIEIKVETNGAIGILNELSLKDIKEADAVIIASDISLDLKRFHQKKLKIVSTTKAIRETESILEEAFQDLFPIYLDKDVT